MSAAVEEVLALEVIFVEADRDADTEARERNHEEVMTVNRQASEVDHDDLMAFLELVYAVDPDYIEAQEYVPEPPAPMVDWESVSAALAESQEILIKVQQYLSEILAGMEVEDHDAIRIYADTNNQLRLVLDHPRREEIERELNGPKHMELRSLYITATSGMSLAGSLVGSLSVPDGVLDQIKAKSGDGVTAA